MKTRSDEYRFRDVGWRQAENAKVEKLYRSFSSACPNLISPRRPDDES